jgi:hypothetical protein
LGKTIKKTPKGFKNDQRMKTANSDSIDEKILKMVLRKLLYQTFQWNQVDHFSQIRWPLFIRWR